MPPEKLKQSKTLLIAVVALVIGLEAPAAAQQISHKISGSTIKANTVTGKQVKESTLATVPKAQQARMAARAASLPRLKWHPLTLQNNWVNGGTPGAAAYATDAQGIVHLRGSVYGGTSGTVAFTLPSNAAPSAGVVEAVQALNGVGQMELYRSGQAYLLDQGTGSSADVGDGTFLDSVTFSRY